MQVPGFMHPVQRFYLEDVLETLRSAPPQCNPPCVCHSMSCLGSTACARPVPSLCEQSGAHACHARCRYNLPHKQPGKQAGQAERGMDPEYAAEVDAAIQAAFLSGTDEDFEHLVEVGPAAINSCAEYSSCGAQGDSHKARGHVSVRMHLAEPCCSCKQCCVWLSPPPACPELRRVQATAKEQYITASSAVDRRARGGG